MLYISFAAVIVLKMAAPGGYAAQVGMTSPVALLFMVGLIAVAATGTFIWLKKQLGDHTRRTLTQKIHSSVDHTKSGWHKGQRARDKIEAAAAKVGGTSAAAQGAAGQGAAGGSAPLTGTPTAGRRPGAGRAATNGRRTGAPGAAVAPTTNPAAGTRQQSNRAGGAGSPSRNGGAAPAAARGTGAKTAAKTAATIAAPEAAAAAATASSAGKAVGVNRRDPSTVQQGRNATGALARNGGPNSRGGATQATPPIPQPYRGPGAPTRFGGEGQASQPPSGSQAPSAPPPIHDDQDTAGPARGRAPLPGDGQEKAG